MEKFDNFISELKTLISFGSVTGEPKENMPFGENVYLALKYFLDLAKKKGFSTINYDNYGGEIIFGDGEEEIGIIGHLDVVPTGNGWNTDPFTLVDKDGMLYGRGVADDKTPMLLILYVLDELKRSGFKPKKKIRFFVGCDEETGWRDVEYIQKKTRLPEYGFSPDGNFPLSYAEKGVFNTRIKLPLLKNFRNVSGGTVINAVCGEASCTADVIDENLLSKHGLTHDENVIKSVGVSAHGSHPELGKNALLPLFEYFRDCGENVQSILDALFYDKFGLCKLNTEQGFVTLSPDIIFEKDGELIIDCDCRVPAPLTLSDVTSVWDKTGLNYRIDIHHPPVVVEKDGWFVNTLLSSYRQIMGEGEPVSMGGSTFARAFKYGCSFGIEFMDEDLHMHEPNERISKSTILKSYEIYKLAIKSLSE